MAHNGTYTNGPTLGVPGLVVGDADTAVTFNPASNQYVVGNDQIGAQTFTAFTIGCIINTPNPTDPNGPVLWGIDSPVNGELVLGLDGSGRPQCRAFPETAGSNLTLTGAILSANTTYRLIGTWDGTTANLYVNGASIASSAYVATLDTLALSFYAAGDQNDLIGNLTYNGTLDECFFVVNHGATAGEVATIDAAWTGTGSASAAVLALNPYIFWRLGESSGTTAVDSSGGVLTGNFRFNPPTENVVSNVAFDVPPIWNRLRRYYPVGPRGRAVWKLEDDTFTFDQPYPSTEDTIANRDSLFPAVPTPPSGYGTSTSNLTAVTYKQVYLGGHTYVVDSTEEALLAAFLTAQGYTPGDWLVPL